MKFITKSMFFMLLIVAASFVLFACQKNANSNPLLVSQSGTLAENITSINDITLCGAIQEEPLTAGQTIPAGFLQIGNDTDNIYVTYNTENDWLLQEVHLKLVCNNGGDCILLKSSDLAPGKFPYSQSFSPLPAGGSITCGLDGLPASYTFTIPRSTLGDCSCFCVYAHAAVIRCINGSSTESQTAWGGGVKRISNGKWYGSTSYCTQTCIPGNIK